MSLVQHLEQGIRPISRFCNPLAYSMNSTSLFHRLPSTSSPMFIKTAGMKQKSKAEAKESAAKKHSEAERRRRLRINCQYATLRTILPNLVKLDKASVLGETVRYLLELEKTVEDLKPFCPSEEDSLKVSYCNGDDDRGLVKGLVKVVFSSRDRMQLLSEFTASLKSAKGKVVKSEFVTVGGRTKCVLWVQGINGHEGATRLRKALKPVVYASLSTGDNNQHKLRSSG